jgi:hypothetical protein
MGRRRRSFPCTFRKACNVLWAVFVKGWSQTEAAIVVELNSGTVSHIVRRRRFPYAYPIPIPGFE